MKEAGELDLATLVIWENAFQILNDLQVQVVQLPVHESKAWALVRNYPPPPMLSSKFGGQTDNPNSKHDSRLCSTWSHTLFSSFLQMLYF